MTEKHYTLIGPDGQEMLSAVPGTLGGNRRLKIYGHLGCRSAIGSFPTGYAKHRVFFADEATAIAAGYRPCGTCMQDEYNAWVEEAMRSGRLKRGASGVSRALERASDLIAKGAHEAPAKTSFATTLP